MHRLAVMPRCATPCASCDACPPGGRAATLAEARALFTHEEILLGGGDATKWPYLDMFLSEARTHAVRVWVEAPAIAFTRERLRVLKEAGVHGVLVQIEGVGEKLLRVMRAGDGERVIADAESLGLETQARVIARPATFPMIAPLATRLAPRVVWLELVRRDWGKEDVPMHAGPLSRLLLACPNISFSGHRALDRGHLPPCVLPSVWASRPTAFRTALSHEVAGEAGHANTLLPICSECTLRTRCRFQDRNALTGEDLKSAVPIQDKTLPWDRMRTTQTAVPASITRKRSGPEVICTTPWTTMEVVDPDGRVRQCCSTWTEGDRGNVHQAPLTEIWNGSGYQKARQQMSQAEHRALCNPICSRLHDRKYSETEFRIQTGSERFVENQLRIAEDIAERREIVTSKPLRLALCPSTYCNYDCIMCDLGRTPRRELPESIWEELPAFLPTLQTLTMLGGEPLANPSTMRFLREFDVAKYPDCAIDFVTNGSLLSESVLQRMQRCTLGDITVSLNAGTAEVYERVQRGIEMARVLQNLDALIRFRGTHHRWFGITLSFVVQPASSHTLIAFGELAHARNLRIRLMALNPENHEGLDFYPDAEAVQKVLRDVDAFEAWTRRVRPEWLSETHATRAALAAEAVARTRAASVRRLPIYDEGSR